MFSVFRLKLLHVLVQMVLLANNCGSVAQLLPGVGGRSWFQFTGSYFAGSYIAGSYIALGSTGEQGGGSKVLVNQSAAIYLKWGGGGTGLGEKVMLVMDCGKLFQQSLTLRFCYIKKPQPNLGQMLSEFYAVSSQCVCVCVFHKHLLVSSLIFEISGEAFQVIFKRVGSLWLVPKTQKNGFFQKFCQSWPRSILLFINTWFLLENPREGCVWKWERSPTVMSFKKLKYIFFVLFWS